MGGDFGGKETQNCFTSTTAAAAAKCTNRPMLLTLPYDVDMLTTRHCHCFLSKYYASSSITEDSENIESMQIQLFANGGWRVDLSGPIVGRALFPHGWGIEFSQFSKLRVLYVRLLKPPILLPPQFWGFSRLGSL